MNESLENQTEQKSLNSVNNFNKEFRLMRKSSSYHPKNQIISTSVVKNESLMNSAHQYGESVFITSQIPSISQTHRNFIESVPEEQQQDDDEKMNLINESIKLHVNLRRNNSTCVSSNLIKKNIEVTNNLKSSMNS